MRTWDVWPCHTGPQEPPRFVGKLLWDVSSCRAGRCRGRRRTPGCSPCVAIAPRVTSGESFRLPVPPPRCHYAGARRTDAQGRGEDLVFKALGSLLDLGWDRLAPARVPLLLSHAKQGMGFPCSCPAMGGWMGPGARVSPCPNASGGEGEPAG